MSVRNLALLLAALVLATLVTTYSCGRRGSRLSVLLIIVDTLRPDHLGCYGYDRVRTPNIDSIAADGVRFGRVVTAVPVTAPSITTILTSTYPVFHGVRDNELFTINPALPKLSSLFRGMGYATSGFVGSVVLDRRYGFGDGFDHYDDDMGDQFVVYNRRHADQAEQLNGTQRRAADVTRPALEWLEREGRKRPFFCMVHYFDPHLSYDPPPPFNKMYSGAPYDGEVAYTDSQIGVLLDGLRNLGLEKNTLVVFTSDHGEDLGEHGEEAHGFLLYDATVMVPLVFCLPGRIPGGRTISIQVRTLDIMPTILELAGLKVPATAQGVSLAPAVRGNTEPQPLDAYLETFHTLYSYGWHELQGVRSPRWKYVRAPEKELYDLAADPGECSNIFEANSEVAQQMEAVLADIEHEFAKGADRYKASRATLEPELTKKMRTLGYITTHAQSAKALPEPREDRPDPKVKVREWSARQTANSFLRVAFARFNDGDFDGALEMIAHAGDAAPDYSQVSASKGMMVWKKGDVEEGIELMELALKEDPRGVLAFQTLSILAVAYLQKGECPKAVESLQRSLQLQPENPQVFYDLGAVYERCGEPGKAAEMLEEFLNRNPKGDPDSSLRRKITYLRSKRGG